jgi:hypothetical protein
VRGLQALAATLVVASVVRADAPPGQYDTFGRTDTCITDALTLLTWMRTPETTTSFADATSKCTARGTGWRVPTMNELETLVDETPHDELENGVYLPKAIDANAFPGTPVTSAYWTSSAVSGAIGEMWTVGFQDGSTAPSAVATPSLEVRCVIVASSSAPSVCQ